jgi:hypothetical protein
MAGYFIASGWAANRQAGSENLRRKRFSGQNCFCRKIARFSHGGFYRSQVAKSQISGRGGRRIFWPGASLPVGRCPARRGALPAPCGGPKSPAPSPAIHEAASNSASRLKQPIVDRILLNRFLKWGFGKEIGRDDGATGITANDLKGSDAYCKEYFLARGGTR